MQIKKRLQINVTVSVLMALVMCLVFFLSLYRINKANNLAKVAGDITTGTLERLTFRNDYLWNNGERAKEQWFAKHEQIGNILKSASDNFTSAEDRNNINQMIDHHESIGKNFSAIVANREKSGLNPASASLQHEVEDRLISQMNMMIYDIVIHNRQLLESSRKARASVLRQAVGGIVCLLVIVFAVAFFISRNMGRTITDRVGRLRNGAAVIGRGDLNYRIDVTGDDEFSDIAEAYNAMTAKLQGTYHDLESEIEERKRAEDTLRKAHDELELHVQERTKELKDAEISLREMNETLEQRVAERMTELQAANASLRASRVAALNLMEDALAARQEADEANAELRQEITERKKAEEDIRRAKEEWERTFDSVPDLIAILDNEHRIVQVNKAMAQRLGFKPEECIGLHCYEHVHGLTCPPEFCPHVRTINDSCQHFQEVHEEQLGGDFLVSTTPVFNEQGQMIGSVHVAHDITERKRMEEDMAVRNEALEYANRELESFVYSVSHDLRAPLRSISGFSRFLIEDYAGKFDATGRDYLARILKGSEKMSLLIDDLLSVSQISRQEMNRSHVDLGGIALSVVSTLRDSDPARNVEVRITENVSGFADRRLMEIVLSNLIGNSWKFTSKTENALIEFGATEKEGQVVFFVRDNGAGFDPAYMKKMFLPFQRLHSATEFEGTGIGLAIVERVIRRHGGRVWAEGEAGKGATVFFTLA